MECIQKDKLEIFIEKHSWTLTAIFIFILLTDIAFMIMNNSSEIVKVTNEKSEHAMLDVLKVKAEWDNLKTTIRNAKEYEDYIYAKKIEYEKFNCIPRNNSFSKNHL